MELTSSDLEIPVVIALQVHIETLDGNGKSRAFSLAHFCEPTAVADSSNDHFLLNDIRARYDATVFAELGKQ